MAKLVDDQEITAREGQAVTIAATLYQQDDTAYSAVTGLTVTFTVIDNYYDKTALVTKTITNGTPDHGSFASGVWTFDINASDMTMNAGIYPWEITIDVLADSAGARSAGYGDFVVREGA